MVGIKGIIEEIGTQLKQFKITQLCPSIYYSPEQRIRNESILPVVVWLDLSKKVTNTSCNHRRFVVHEASCVEVRSRLGLSILNRNTIICEKQGRFLD